MSLIQSFRLIQTATVFVFLGRAWQHLFWDAPFRVLLWDELWMKRIIEGIFHTPWERYITSMALDDGIQYSIQGVGVFYLLCAIVAAFIFKVPKWTAKILLLGAAGLFFLACLYCKEKFFSLGQLLEYSTQIVSPLLLYFWVYPKWKAATYRLIAKVAIAFTFICHGLYAVNYYPRPGNFVEMILNTFGVSEATAVQLLLAAGIIDFMVSIAIFIPGKIAKVALSYIVFWGFATTFARYTSYLDFSYLLESLSQWTWQVMIRFPHFMIPLAILIFQEQRRGLRMTSLQRNQGRRKPILFPET
ncbi:MAG: hypothetical protein ACI9XB_004924 [Gammaproteobacteria bacterium]|jgi:hypothetical protein